MVIIPRRAAIPDVTIRVSSKLPGLGPSPDADTNIAAPPDGIKTRQSANVVTLIFLLIAETRVSFAFVA